MRIASRRLLVGQLAAAAAALGACSKARAEGVTPRETEGPFYPRTKPSDTDADLTRLAGRTERAAGEVIEVRARVLNASGQPVQGARIELWQCNAAGRYDHPGDTSGNPLDPNFQGYADLRTGPDGGFRVLTIKPAAYKIPGGETRTPHIHVKAAGRRDRLTTQMYFPGEALNETDLLMRAMADPRPLISRAGPAAEAGVKSYLWEIVLAHG